MWHISIRYVNTGENCKILFLVFCDLFFLKKSVDITRKMENSFATFNLNVI